MEQKLYLQAIIIKKPTTLKEAYTIVQEILKNKKKTFYRETDSSYRFRNIPKTQFIPDSFVSKVVNDKVTLVFGRLES